MGSKAWDTGLGGTRTTYTGVNNSSGGKKPGLKNDKVMVSYGVYQTRDVALNLTYNGYDAAADDVDYAFKAKVTIPEKWLDNPTPVSTLKAFFLKTYRKKHPGTPLSCLDDSEVTLAIKDESMFQFSKKVVPDDAEVRKHFWDRQDIFVMGPADWKAMDVSLKEYRKVIVQALAHCHRSVTPNFHPDWIVPVTSARQITPTNTYLILTGWYKMQCVVVKPEFTIADVKQYLHEKNGARMPVECIDIGVRSGEDIKIIDDALTLQMVFEQTLVPNGDFAKGPGCLMEGRDDTGEEVGTVTAEENEAMDDAFRKAQEDIERNASGPKMDAKYFSRHDTTSRVHADWDDENSRLKTYAVDDQVHNKGGTDAELVGPQKPMYLRKTHAEPEGKYGHVYHGQVKRMVGRTAAGPGSCSARLA